MRRELSRMMVALVVCGSLGACRQSAEDRARHAAARAHEELSVRHEATVGRLTSPQDSGRILYDAPSDLSASKTDTAHTRSDKAQSKAPPIR
jgi:hypothetical protein